MFRILIHIHEVREKNDEVVVKILLPSFAIDTGFEP